MLQKVTETIYKLVINPDSKLNSVNCFLVKGDSGYTVVDTGFNTSEAKVLWESVLDSDTEIEKVVLTHTHQDHIGLAKWFQQEKGIPVYIVELSYKEIKRYRTNGNREKLNGLIKSHGGKGFPGKLEKDTSIYDFEPDGLIRESDKIKLGDDYYEIIWTPGHAPDHYCFYNQDRKIMFIGDHILRDMSPVIGMWSGYESNILSDYYCSLERMKKYTSDIALPGHGEPIFHLSERVNQVKARHNQRLQEVYESIRYESKTANQICEEIYGDSDNQFWLAQFLSIVTRLVYLEAEARIRRETSDGIIMFRSV
ncbi:MBL fold metallo-hydrolase [Virgibacillus sp. DJP39]|uniref:MBL fold metallo-hydrolase n=1 Tax=Virgibacillus sp. DJP39 TaxID=3409790 RepID=UPI003BB4BF2F